jgi:hypothetical protein
MPHSVSDRYLFESKNTHFFFLFKMTKKEKRQSVAHFYLSMGTTIVNRLNVSRSIHSLKSLPVVISVSLDYSSGLHLSVSEDVVATSKCFDYIDVP